MRIKPLIGRGLLLVAAMMILLTGCQPKEEGARGAPMQKSFAEIAGTLERYGVTGTTEQMLDELEESYARFSPEAESDKTLLLLSVLGSGNYDYSSRTFTPSHNGVYSFDTEVFDLEKAYTTFLVGVSALDEEELDFENVREDTSQVNWEEGSGKTTIAFEWQGEQHVLEARVRNDWFDLSVAGELNEIIKKHESGKQLYFTDDGYQGCIVFYRTQEWAKRFQEETGIDLHDGS